MKLDFKVSSGISTRNFKAIISNKNIRSSRVKIEFAKILTILFSFISCRLIGY